MSRKNGKAKLTPVYQFRKGARVTGITPATAAEELARIEMERGSLRAEDVVEEAAPEGAPLHPAFEWNDAEAARQHRLQQARTLIRAVLVRYEEQPEAAPRAVYVHVADEEPSYRPMTAVVQVEEQFKAALRELQRKLDSARQSCAELLQLAERNPTHKLRTERVLSTLETASTEAQELLEAAV